MQFYLPSPELKRCEFHLICSCYFFLYHVKKSVLDLHLGQNLLLYVTKSQWAFETWAQFMVFCPFRDRIHKYSRVYRQTRWYNNRWQNVMFVKESGEPSKTDEWLKVVNKTFDMDLLINPIKSSNWVKSSIFACKQEDKKTKYLLMCFLTFWKRPLKKLVCS